jgi:hypothetical protein
MQAFGVLSNAVTADGEVGLDFDVAVEALKGLSFPCE